MAASNKPFFPFVLLALWLLCGCGPQTSLWRQDGQRMVGISDD